MDRSGHGNAARLRAVSLAFGVALGVLVSAQSAAADALVAPAPETITVALTVPNRDALAALAQTHGISTEERLRRLEMLLPDKFHKDHVVAALRSAGFTGIAVGRSLVTATAPTVQTQARAQGLLRAGSSTALSGTAGILNGLATAVYTSSNPGPPRTHAALPYGPTGAALRTSYSTAQPGAPSPATVASLQYSGWNPADLSSYASSIGVPDPVANGRYVGVAVNPRRTTSRLSQDGDGDSEVALDQQALLSVAPNLKQRAYFAANSTEGELRALEQIAADAMVPSNNIVALTISWGLCEDNYFDAAGNIDTQSLHAELDAFNTIAAAGVTIFAASGDSGAYDCAQPGDVGPATTKEFVDTPAAFPAVIGVGGTSLTLNDIATNTDDVEVAWVDPSNNGAGAFLGSAGGGGISRLIQRPDYQRALTSSYTGRAVPDISALADPSDRFAAYWARGGGWLGVGGTSLAAPLSAGMFAAEVVAHGQTTGIGSIHAALYNGPIYSGTHQSLRDITTGDISFGRNGAFVAGAGYDLSTGLGAPMWGEIVSRAVDSVDLQAPAAARSTTVPVSVRSSSTTTITSWKIQALNADAPDPGCLAEATSSPTPPTAAHLPSGDGAKVIYLAGFRDGTAGCEVARASVLLDTIAPTLSLTAALAAPTTNKVASSWAAGDTSGSGVDHYAVRVTHSQSSSADVNVTSTTSTANTLLGIGGRTYTVLITAYDKAGNSRSMSKQVDVPLDDSYFSTSGTWKRVSSTSHYGSAASVSTTKASTMSGRVSYRSLSLIIATGANNGRVDVLVDGIRVKTIDTYSATTSYRKTIAIQSLASTGTHTVTLRVRGDRAAASKGITAVIDALLLHS